MRERDMIRETETERRGRKLKNKRREKIEKLLRMRKREELSCFSSYVFSIIQSRI
jgi:hypothetical protein